VQRPTGGAGGFAQGMLIYIHTCHSFIVLNKYIGRHVIIKIRISPISVYFSGKESRAAGGAGGINQGSLSHNPVMHRLKVHGIAEVQPRTPR